MLDVIHISRFSTRIACPHCGAAYTAGVPGDACDLTITETRRGYNTTRCRCAARFGYALDMTGDAVAFALGDAAEESKSNE